MTSQARVGRPVEDCRAVCLYSFAPGHPRCANTATVHVLIDDAHYGPVSLPTCDEHASVARASGVYVLEHAFEGWCGFPGTYWVGDPVNRCELDDSGPNRMIAAARQVPAKAVPA